MEQRLDATYLKQGPSAIWPLSGAK
jgi:hypothetical protein